MQGWRSGESTRLPPMWPGFDSQIRRHMWVEFVGSLLCTERFFPGTPVSPLLKKPPFDLICVLPYKGLMGMCRWMGSHFHYWIDYNGVTFLEELLEWGRTFSGFL